MLAVELSFPGGRYHATPWNRQVNEGAVEWPPSPWRLLRSMIATWYLKGDGVDESAFRSAIEKMTSPPEYYLPPVTLSSTCHYMPLYNSGQNDKTVKVYDAFAHVGNGAIAVIWKGVHLDEKEKAALNTIVNRLGYLGRAESWVDARLIDGDVEANCQPLAEANISTGQLASVPCCYLPADYVGWRSAMLQKLLGKAEDEERKKASLKSKAFKGLSGTAVKKIEMSLPETLFDALETEVSDLKESGWSQPPGMTWMKYVLPSQKPKVSFQKERSPNIKPTVARYAMRCSEPVMVMDALPTGDLVHRCLVKLSMGSGTFTGCDANGEPLDSNDTYILCQSDRNALEGRLGRLTGIIVYNKNGFEAIDQKALRAMSKLERWGHHDIDLVLLGLGTSVEAGTGLTPHQIFGSSRKWTSVTPFVPTRCPKTTRAGVPKLDETGLQIGSAEHELRRLLKVNGYPEPIAIRPVHRARIGESSRSWLEFRRKRQNSDRAPLNDAGFGFEIEFAEPVYGPLALGYANHYGLGMFQAVVR